MDLSFHRRLFFNDPFCFNDFPHGFLDYFPFKLFFGSQGHCVAFERLFDFRCRSALLAKAKKTDAEEDVKQNRSQGG